MINTPNRGLLTQAHLRRPPYLLFARICLNFFGRLQLYIVWRRPGRGDDGRPVPAGLKLVDVCIAAGAYYLDVTGEILFVHEASRATTAQAPPVPSLKSIAS